MKNILFKFFFCTLAVYIVVYDWDGPKQFFPTFRPENGPQLIHVVNLYMSKDGTPNFISQLK